VKAKELPIEARQIALSMPTQLYHQISNFKLSRENRKKNYNSSVGRFQDLSTIAERATQQTGSEKLYCRLVGDLGLPRLAQCQSSAISPATQQYL